VATTSIETTRLGRSGLTVSRVCYGTGPIGHMPEVYGHGSTEELAYLTVRAIFDGPSNFMDTSRNYGAGRSEERIGHVIRERGGIPKGFVLATKLDRNPDTNRFDAASMRRSLETSFAALGVDRVGLLHIHDPEYAADLDEVTKPGGGLAELYRMKEEGLCDAVGLAAGRVDVMMPILERFDFDAMITHNRFTLVNRNADAMIDFAASKGIAVINAAPFAGGVFAKGSAASPRYVYQEASDALLRPVRAVEAICARYGVPAGAVALQFSMRDPRIASTICGVGRPEEVTGVAEWANCPVPPALWDEIAALPASRDDPEATRNYVAPS
jgi:D-threo-aldose 1-dehydrogenase